jgi:hypothetical protein
MGYSPPRDRSPTCYSPVRHCPQGPKPPVPVRLACLRRAASVSSEPGSNSPSYYTSLPHLRREASLLYAWLVDPLTSVSRHPPTPPALFTGLPGAEKHHHCTSSSCSSKQSLLVRRALLRPGIPFPFPVREPRFRTAIAAGPRGLLFSKNSLRAPPPPEGVKTQGGIYSTPLPDVKYLQ